MGRRYRRRRAAWSRPRSREPAEDRKAARQLKWGGDRRAFESAAPDDVGAARRRQQGDRDRRRSARLAARIVRRSRAVAETRQAGAGDRKRPRGQGRPGRVASLLAEKFVMPGFVPGIHVLAATKRKTWMAGSSPAMTEILSA